MAGASAPVQASSSAPPSGLGRYVKLEKLGEGNYGCVYKARDIVTGQLVALKKIKLDEEDDGVPSTALREVALLLDCQHKHIAKLEQVIMERGQIYLVFEYMDLDLRRYLDNIHAANPAAAAAAAAAASASIAIVPSHAPLPPFVPGLPMPLVKSYVYQILLGVEHMHSRRHLHRDLKPQNLLIDRRGRMQIADLGLARAIAMPMPPVTHEVATLWYRPPEILLGSKPYSSPVDIWAIGTIMAEMISLTPSFPGDSEIDTLFRIFRARGTPVPDDSCWPGVDALPDWHATFPKWSRPSTEGRLRALHIRPEHGLDADGIDLLDQMLELNPARRISARRALQHAWFTKDNMHNLSLASDSDLKSQAEKVAIHATLQAKKKRAEKLKKTQEAKRLAKQQQQQKQHANGMDDGEEEEEELDEVEGEDEDEGFHPGGDIRMQDDDEELMQAAADNDLLSQ